MRVFRLLFSLFGMLVYRHIFIVLYLIRFKQNRCVPVEK